MSSFERHSEAGRQSEATFSEVQHLKKKVCQLEAINADLKAKLAIALATRCRKESDDRDQSKSDQAYKLSATGKAFLARLRTLPVAEIPPDAAALLDAVLVLSQTDSQTQSDHSSSRVGDDAPVHASDGLTTSADFALSHELTSADDSGILGVSPTNSLAASPKKRDASASVDFVAPSPKRRKRDHAVAPRPGNSFEEDNESGRVNIDTSGASRFPERCHVTPPSEEPPSNTQTKPFPSMPPPLEPGDEDDERVALRQNDTASVSHVGNSVISDTAVQHEHRVARSQAVQGHTGSVDHVKSAAVDRASSLPKAQHRFRCPAIGCVYSTEKKWNLRRHIDRQHTIKQPARPPPLDTCESSDEEIGAPALAFVHATDSSTKVQIACIICKLTTSLRALDNHIDECHAPRQCNQCSRIVRGTHAMKQHLDSFHPGPTFRCRERICRQMFYTERERALHVIATHPQHDPLKNGTWRDVELESFVRRSREEESTKGLVVGYRALLSECVDRGHRLADELLFAAIARRWKIKFGLDKSASSLAAGSSTRHIKPSIESVDKLPTCPFCHIFLQSISLKSHIRSDHVHITRFRDWDKLVERHFKSQMSSRVRGYVHTSRKRSLSSKDSNFTTETSTRIRLSREVDDNVVLGTVADEDSSNSDPLYFIERTEKGFKCPYCRPPDLERVFSRFLFFRNHLRDHEFRFPCPHCDASFPSRKDSLEHVWEEHQLPNHLLTISDLKPLRDRINELAKVTGVDTLKVDHSYFKKEVIRIFTHLKERPGRLPVLYLDAIAHKCGNINLNVGKNEKKRQEYYNKDRRHGVELLRVECPLCKQRFRGFINYWLHCKRIHNISVPPELTTPTFAHASQPQPTDRRVPPAGVKAKKQKVRRLGSNRTVDNGSGHGAPAAATVVKRESESSDGVDSASRPTTSYDDVVVVAGEESHPAGQVYAMSVGHMRERDAAVNGATKAVSSGDFHKLLEVIRHTLNYAHCRSFLEGRASPPFLDSNSLPSEVYIRFIRDQLIRDIHEEKQRRDSEIRSHRSDATQNPVSARLANMAGAHQHTRTLFEVESLLQVVSAYESIVLSRSAHQWYGHPSVSPYNVHEHNRTLAGVHDDTPVGTRTLCVPPLRGDFVSGGHRPEPNERQHGGSFGSRNRESAVSSSLPSLSDILSSGGVAIARSQHSPSVPGGRVADSHRPSVSDRPPLERDSRSRSRSPDSRIGKPSGTDDRRREYSSDVDPRPTKRLRTSPSSSSDHTRPPGHVTSQRSDESQESMRLYTSSAMRRHHRGTFPLSTSAAETVDDIEVRARQVELEARARAVAGADAMHALANESEGSQHETTPTAHRPSQPPSSSTRRHRSSTVHPPSLPSRRVFTLTPLASPRASAVGGSEADSDTDTRNRVTSPRSGARKRKPKVEPEVDRPYVCETCSRGFPSQRALSNHKINHRSPFECSHDGCVDVFSTKRQQLIHEMRDHSMPDPLQDWTHEELLPFVEAMRARKKPKNDDTKRRPPSKPYKFVFSEVCTIGDRPSPTPYFFLAIEIKYNLMFVDYRSLTLDRQYGCLQCPAKFLTNRALTAHKRSMHPRKKTTKKCPNCGVGVLDGNQIKHQQVHSHLNALGKWRSFDFLPFIREIRRLNQRGCMSENPRVVFRKGSEDAMSEAGLHDKDLCSSLWQALEFVFDVRIEAPKAKDAGSSEWDSVSKSSDDCERTVPIHASKSLLQLLKYVNEDEDPISTDVVELRQHFHRLPDKNKSSLDGDSASSNSDTDNGDQLPPTAPALTSSSPTAPALSSSSPTAPALTSSSLTAHALTSSSLTAHALTSSSLTAHALTSSSPTAPALSSSSLTAHALSSSSLTAHALSSSSLTAHALSSSSPTAHALSSSSRVLRPRRAKRRRRSSFPRDEGDLCEFVPRK